MQSQMTLPRSGISVQLPKSQESKKGIRSPSLLSIVCVTHTEVALR